MCYQPILIAIEPKYRPLGSGYALDGEIHGKVYREVPCGRCLECKRRYQQDWANRCYEEWKSNDYKGVFFTLTYRDDSIPINYLVRSDNGTVSLYKSDADYNYSSNMSLSDVSSSKTRKGYTISSKLSYVENKRGSHIISSKNAMDCIPEDASLALLNGEAEVECFNSVRKRDIQLWLKRSRKQLNKKFTYYITSEYGPGTLRPHYHGLLFGLTAEECVSIFADWKKHYGNVVFDDVKGEGGMNYTASYAAKGIFEHPLCRRDFFYPKPDGSFTEYHSKDYEICKHKYGINQPIVDKTFHSVSKGFGIGYLTPQRKEYYRLKFNTKEDYIRLYEKLKYVNRKGYSVHLPDYYRKKIVSRFIQCKMQAVVRERDCKVYQEQYGFVEAHNICREAAEIFDDYETEQRKHEIEYRKRRVLDKYNSFIKKSKL